MYFPVLFEDLTGNNPKDHQRLFLLEARTSSPNKMSLEVDFLDCGSIPFQTDTSLSSKSGLQGTKGYFLIDGLGTYCKYSRSEAISRELYCEHHGKSMSNKRTMCQMYLLCHFCLGHL